MHAPGLRNIIFDLGGVLLRIDFARAAQAFSRLGFTNFSAHYAQQHQSQMFEDFETGRLTREQVYERLCAKQGISVTQFVTAWNAMILGFDQETFAILAKLRQDYRLFLLSNTNPIHYDYFHEVLKRDIGASDLAQFFEGAYYSHTLGLRKPDPASYQAVLGRHHLRADETLFVDDTAPNLVGAAAVGLHTYHVTAAQPLSGLTAVLKSFS